MSTEHDSERQLEQQVQRLLRSLPPRRAPEALAARVLEQLAQRAAVPWWRRQVSQWPALARVLFALVGLTLMLASLAGSTRLPRLPGVANPLLSWPHPLAAPWRIFPELVSTLLHALPTAWLQAAAMLALLAYLFVLGFGTAAYRLLYLER